MMIGYGFGYDAYVEECGARGCAPSPQAGLRAPGGHGGHR